jgi:hypothetical protein
MNHVPSVRSVIVDFTEYLTHHPRREPTAAPRALPLHIARPGVAAPERRLAHRRRMLEHLSTSAREYA